MFSFCQSRITILERFVTLPLMKTVNFPVDSVKKIETDLYWIQI